MNLTELLDAMSAQRAANENRITKSQKAKMEAMPLIDWDCDFDIENLKKQAGRQWRVIFGNIETLLKRCLKAPNPSYFELSVYDSELMSKFGGARMTIQRTIQHACKLGFLACVDSSYRFGADNKKFCKSKKYALNEKMAKQFSKMCYSKSSKNEADHNPDNSTDNGGTGLSINDGNDTLYHIFEDDAKSGDLTTYITSSQHVFKLRGIKMGNETEAQVESFYDEFPFLPLFQSEAEELNRTFYADFVQLKSRWIPTISDKGVGFRATSKACQTRKGEERERVIFEPYFGHRDDVYHFDVKSSIYQINHALRFGRWAGNEVDFYQMIAGCQLSPEQRDSMKILCQQVYFCEEESRLGANVMWRAGLCRIADASELKNIALELKKRMIESIGEPVGKHVFVFESCVYHRLLKQLLSEGYKVVQVYDCFYSDDRAAVLRAESLLPQIAESTLREIGAIESKPLTMNENENQMNENNTTTNTDNDDLESFLSNMSWRDIEALGAPSQPRSRYGADTLTYQDCEEALGLTSEINEDAVETPCEDVMEKNTTESVERPQEAIERETEAVLEDNVEPVVEQTEVKPVETVKDDDETIDDVLNQIAKEYDLAHAGQKTTPVTAMDDDALDALIDRLGVEGGVKQYKDSGRSNSTRWNKIDISRHDAPQRGQQQYKKAMIFALNH